MKNTKCFRITHLQGDDEVVRTTDNVIADNLEEALNLLALNLQRVLDVKTIEVHIKDEA